MTTHPLQPLNLDLCHFQARCKVVRKLGVGAFAEVYEVVFDNQRAALKVLLPSKHSEEEIVMFKREAVVLQHCRHRNIVSFKSLLQVPPGVRGISGSAARWAMLIELVKGESAASMLTKQLQAPSRCLYTQHQAVRWCKDVGLALLYLHNIDIVHRDVKPDNVLLCRSSSDGVAAKLADCGLHHMVGSSLAKTLPHVGPNQKYCRTPRSSSSTEDAAASSLGCSFSSSNTSSDLDFKFKLQAEDTGLAEHDALPGCVNRTALLGCLNREPAHSTAPEVEVQGYIRVQTLEVQDISIHCSEATADTSSLACPRRAIRRARWATSAAADESALSQSVMCDPTGRTGSSMYMAPEVYRCEPYNEKADVYSFGVMMYEILGCTLNVLVHGHLDKEMYCQRICDGFRPSQPSCIPRSLWSIITACWDAEPCNRPDMEWVVEQLIAWLEQEHEALMEKAAPKCSGCTVS